MSEQAMISNRSCLQINPLGTVGFRYITVSAFAPARHFFSRKLVEASACIHVRNAKTTFNQAVQEDLILFNPFDRLKGTAREPDKTWKYVSLDELDELLNACPNWGWKLQIALCRLAGLRRGEALSLTWADIDWDRHRLTVIAEKTGARRVVPIEPKLSQLLLDAFAQAEEGVKRVCPISRHCLWRDFQSIRKRAGLDR